MLAPTSCPRKKAVIVNGKVTSSNPVPVNKRNKIIRGIGRWIAINH
jgi:hypothetical protein